MTKIANDRELRAALDRLDPRSRRLLGCRFAEAAVRLASDERIRRAIETGLRPEATAAEIEDVYKVARAYATRTYAVCGRDTDWLAQADHFLAAAAAAALASGDAGSEGQTGNRNPAWKSAVQVRMAVNCESMERDEVQDETSRQYVIASEFIG
jgi:hypothetical protein